MDYIKQIIDDVDLIFIVLTSQNKNSYKLEWFFRNKFEMNGFREHLTKEDYHKICNYIDENYTNLIKSYKKYKTIFVKNTTIDKYMKEEN